MLLVMTACTILFKDSMDIVLSELTPTAVYTQPAAAGELEPTDTQEIIVTDLPVETEIPTREPAPTLELPIKPESTTVPSNFLYIVQPGSPAYLDNFAHLSEGCSWQGVAGQVFDRDGQPVTNLIVKMSGEWNGQEIAGIGVTGMTAGLPYGAGGYEIVLGNVPADSNAPLYLQVFNQEQDPLTEPVPVVTYADCKKNLVLLNFVTK